MGFKLPGNQFKICQDSANVTVPRQQRSMKSELSSHDEEYTTYRSCGYLQSGEEDVFTTWKLSKMDIDKKRKRDSVKPLKTDRVQTNLDKIRLNKSKHLDLQSGEETETENTSAVKVTAENMMFTDEALSQRITMGDMTSGNYDADADVTAGLGEYLSRPVRIFSFNWDENSFFQTDISPWHLFFNTPQIKRKLDNYGKISCRLHIKFVINASPFYYGSLRACYFPLVDPRSAFFNAVDQVPFSQTPGVYLEPQNMSTAEMVLPFLWTRNWLEATSAADFLAMGRLQFLQYAALRSANGVSGTGITVSVYAWAEDIRLMGPTTILALQSDEYEGENTTISGPATAIANVASKLTDVPVIGEFARATNIGATAVASIAKLFGYSNPPMIDDVKPVQNKTFHAFANVETRMPIDKLSIDPKNEVTISSKVAGIEEEDPLAFSNLLTRESFLQGTLWSNSQASDTLLWSALVTPGYFVEGGGYSVSPPMAHFGWMFKLWRGSLIYKFRFIKTKYHKGRVLISWDPNGDSTGTADTETTTFSRIVDLAVEDEVEICVPYKSTGPWLNTEFSSSIKFSNGTSPTYVYNSERYNGTITIRVQNVLTGPAVDPEIDILAYVRAGDDFMYSVPIELSSTRTVRDPAGVLQSSEDVISQEAVAPDDKIAITTTGEIVCSLRPVLHRASLGYQQVAGRPVIGTSAGLQTTVNTINRVPFGVGRNTRGYGYATVSGVGVPYHFAPNHPVDWTLNCFIGYRGSMNIHVNVTGIGDNVARVSHLAISRWLADPITTPTFYTRNTVLVTGSITSPNQVSRSATGTFFPTGQTGMTLTNVQGQPACSSNVPQYAKTRFYQAFAPLRNVDPRTGDIYHDEVAVTCQFTSKNTISEVSDWPVLNYYYSAGVDFQPIFFLCTPRVFTTNMPPAREVFP